MSQAFDTTKQAKILNVLHQADFNDDELHLVRLLLAETRLKVCVKPTHSAELKTSIGSTQGYGHSPMLFTYYLAAALSSVHESFTRPNPPDFTTGTDTGDGICR